MSPTYTLEKPKAAIAPALFGGREEATKHAEAGRAA